MVVDGFSWEMFVFNGLGMVFCIEDTCFSMVLRVFSSTTFVSMVLDNVSSNRFVFR